MLTAFVILGLALAVVGLVVFIAICVAIQREDHSARLSSRPPTAGTAVTRRVAGLSVRRASPPAASGRPDLRPALWASRYPPDSCQERR
jgi:hypothetical protein